MLFNKATAFLFVLTFLSNHVEGRSRLSPNDNERSLQAACRDSPAHWVDVDGFDCLWYAEDPEYACENWGDVAGTNERTANQACCACNGGSKAPAPTPTPPTPSNTNCPPATARAAAFEEEILRLVNEKRAEGATCGSEAMAKKPFPSLKFTNYS